MNFVKGLFLKEDGKPSKMVAWALLMIVVGVLGYSNPDAIHGVDLSGMKEMTWAGIITWFLRLMTVSGMKFQ